MRHEDLAALPKKQSEAQLNAVVLLQNHVDWYVGNSTHEQVID